MNVQKLFAFLLFSISFISVSAQIFPPTNYPQGYFQWPVIATHALAANFGELRPNHYHMGLDCKTDQKENVHGSRAPRPGDRRSAVLYDIIPVNIYVKSAAHWVY